MTQITQIWLSKVTHHLYNLRNLWMLMLLAYASRARGVPAEGRAMALEQPIAEIEQEWLNRGP